jgi:hypothetical protein
MSAPIKEVVFFRLQPNTNEEDFLKDAQATFDLLESYDGYINRELSLDEAGNWIDIVTWRDMDTALQAAEAIMSDPIGQAFGAHIDPDSIQMHHVTPRIQQTTTA